MSLVRTENPLKQILKLGQSIWYDGLVSNEEFEKMINEDGIRGATTNPTIFEKALRCSQYDAEILRLANVQNEEGIYKTLSVKAVQQVADKFLPLYNQTKGRDGFVSIEVSPLLAYDTAKTIGEARELWRLVGRKNIMVKVPATREGIPAVETLIREGININITLIFSIQRYREVMDAYLSGLEKRNAEGKLISSIDSVASFFVSRVDTAADAQIEKKLADAADEDQRNRLRNLLGKAAIANSKMAYQEFEKIFSSPRFQKLKENGANLQRPLWASTGTKNPNYSDVVYVEALIGAYTVNTIPPATLSAFRDHGLAVARLKEGVADAKETLAVLESCGIRLSQITRELEAAGVGSFADSYKKIVQSIAAKAKMRP